MKKAKLRLTLKPALKLTAEQLRILTAAGDNDFHPTPTVSAAVTCQTTKVACC